MVRMTVLDKDIVAEYYIECELDNIVDADAIQLKKDLYHSSTARLLEALSFTYRANSVFDYVYGGQFRWEARTVRVDDITLTGMGEHLTEIIYSEHVQRNPRMFVEYIATHREDPRFDELKAAFVPGNRRTLLLREQGDKITMLDGSHRFLSMIMQGIEEFTAYVAVPLEFTDKPMIGETIFLRMRRLWQWGDAEFKASIEHTVVGMIKETRDGKRAVEAYWVTMAPNDEVRATGREILHKSAL